MKLLCNIFILGATPLFLMLTLFSFLWLLVVPAMAFVQWDFSVITESLDAIQSSFSWVKFRLTYAIFLVITTLFFAFGESL